MDESLQLDTFNTNNRLNMKKQCKWISRMRDKL